MEQTNSGFSKNGLPKRKRKNRPVRFERPKDRIGLGIYLSAEDRENMIRLADLLDVYMCDAVIIAVEFFSKSEEKR